MQCNSKQRGRGMTITNLGHVERQWPKPGSSGWAPDLFMGILSVFAKARMRTACVCMIHTKITALVEARLVCSRTGT